MAEDDHANIESFAAVINSRLASEARISKAVAFGWLCGGWAIASCLIGLGLAAAFYGYSFMISVTPAAERTANALRDAFLRAELKTHVSGILSLAPGSALTLAPDQTVKLAEGAVVKLDPNSSVRVIGDLTQVDCLATRARRQGANASASVEDEALSLSWSRSCS
jgi:hypothetical protein